MSGDYPPPQPYGSPHSQSDQPQRQYGAPQPPVQPQRRAGQGPGPVDPQVAAHPHEAPRTYPLMLRTWTYRWWKPLVGIFLLAFFGFLVVPFVLLPVLAAGVAIQGGAGSFSERFTEASKLKEVTPAAMLYLNLTLAALTLVVWGLVRFVHNLRPRWATSVRPGMRWKFFWVCVGLALVAVIAQFAVGALLPSDPNGFDAKPHHLTGLLIASAVVILLTTPLQAIGEEYAFRGYLTQAVGSLTRSPVLAILVSSLLFALAHGVQNFPLFFDRFAFGLMAGLVVVLVGGLEAGMALHIVNNLLAFGMAILFGTLSSALNASQASWWQLPLTVTQNGVFLVLVLFVARRMGLRRTTSPPAPDDLPSGHQTGITTTAAGPGPIGPA